MAKVSQMYLDIDPFLIKETGYHKERHQVSESIFSLSNEYMGVRGFFDEGISKDKLHKGIFIDIWVDEKISGAKKIKNRKH